MQYTQYLQTDHWNNIRTIHYKKGKNKYCKICKSHEKLHVHHARYFRKRHGNLLYREQNFPHILVTLCKDCHFTWHRLHPKTIFKQKYLIRIKTLMKFNIKKAEAIAFCVGKIFKIKLKELQLAQQATPIKAAAPLGERNTNAI